MSDLAKASLRFDDQHLPSPSPRTSGDSHTFSETVLSEHPHTHSHPLDPETLANQLAIALCRHLGLWANRSTPPQVTDIRADPRHGLVSTIRYRTQAMFNETQKDHPADHCQTEPGNRSICTTASATCPELLPRLPARPTGQSRPGQYHPGSIAARCWPEPEVEPQHPRPLSQAAITLHPVPSSAYARAWDERPS